MVVVNVVPVSIPPFEPQECVTPELFCVLSTEIIPAPGDAEAVTLDVVGAGDVRLKLVGKSHPAMLNPQVGAGVAGALLTINESVAKLPVSSVSIKR